MSINQEINRLKQARALTVRGLGKDAGLHENTVRKALRGENMTVDTAESLLSVLGHRLVVVPKEANILLASEEEV